MAAIVAMSVVEGIDLVQSVIADAPAQHSNDPAYLNSVANNGDDTLSASHLLLPPAKAAGEVIGYA